MLEPYGAAAEWLLDTRDLAEAKDLAEDFPDEAPGGPEPGVRLGRRAGSGPGPGGGDGHQQRFLYAGQLLRHVYRREAGPAGREGRRPLLRDLAGVDDLRCLLDLCSLWDLEVLFVHVPMHGSWNDFTGFDAGRRAAYYQAVRDIAEDYDNVTLLDLTGYEYEPYFLCDTMNTRSSVWLAVDRAIVEFYHAA